MPGLWGVIDGWRIWGFFVWTLRAAPLPIAMALGDWYAAAISLAVRAKRRAAQRNLAAAGIDPRRVARGFRRLISRFAVVLVRFPRLNADNLSEWLRIEGLQHLEDAEKRGRGVLLISGHLGHWELAALGLACLGHRMHLIAYESPHRSMEAYLRKLRTGCGNVTVPCRGAARQTVAALARNERVATLLDVTMPWDSATAEVPFLGGTIRTTTALARLARITGATVLPVFTLWSEEESRFVARIHGPAALSGDPAEDTRRLYAELERVVRQYPEQWFWIFDPGWVH